RMPSLAMRGWKFVWYARAMAEAASIYKDVFFKHGLPPTFLDDFADAIDKLIDSVRDREHNLLRRASATRELALAAKHAPVVLRVLDALMRQAAGGNESLLRSWEAVRLIPRS